jgi:hypothetical protein
MLLAESQIIVNASQFLHKSFQARLAVSLIAFSRYTQLARRVGMSSAGGQTHSFQETETNVGGFTNKTLIESVSFKHALPVALEYGDGNGFSRLDVMF